MVVFLSSFSSHVRLLSLTIKLLCVQHVIAKAIQNELTDLRMSRSLKMADTEEPRNKRGLSGFVKQETPPSNYCEKDGDCNDQIKWYVLLVFLYY